MDLPSRRLNDFETEVFVDCTNEFELDVGDVTRKNPAANVDCYVEGPDGEQVEAYVTKIEPDGPFQAS